MARSRKPHAAAPALGIDALADIVRRGATDSFVIAVAEGSSVTVRTVPRPPRLRRGGVARGAYAGYVARRLAEIEAAVGELLATTTGGAQGTEPGGLTAAEARVLASGGLDTSPLRAGEEEPLIETALEYARLLQSSLSVEQTAQLLGVNPSRVRQRLTGHPRTLYGLKEGRSWRVPRFQFAGRKPVPGIATVIGALPPDLHPVAVRRWFALPHPDLRVDPDEARSVAPLEWLRTGRAPEVVADLARDI
jgi:hypothetical protein